MSHHFFKTTCERQPWAYTKLLKRYTNSAARSVRFVRGGGLGLLVSEGLSSTHHVRPSIARFSRPVNTPTFYRRKIQGFARSTPPSSCSEHVLPLGSKAPYTSLTTEACGKSLMCDIVTQPPCVCFTRMPIRPCMTSMATIISSTSSRKCLS
jgi:hypothetical protein